MLVNNANYGCVSNVLRNVSQKKSLVPNVILDKSLRR